MLDELLKAHGGELLASLTQGGGLEQGQAEKLLPPALDGIGSALGAGGFDLSSLLGGGENVAQSLLGQLDIGKIAGAAGLSEGQTQGGLTSLIPTVLGLLGNEGGGAEGLMSMLGGGETSSSGLGALAGVAGKLFGK